MFGKIKFIKEVYKSINLYIDEAGVPKMTTTLEQIIKEYELNSGKKWDPSMDWHLLIGEQIHNFAYEGRKDLYSRWKNEPNKAAIAAISGFISTLGDNGQIQEMKVEQKEMYESLELLWGMCGFLATGPLHEEYEDAVMVPDKGNPFR